MSSFNTLLRRLRFGARLRSTPRPTRLITHRWASNAAAKPAPESQTGRPALPVSEFDQYFGFRAPSKRDDFQVEKRVVIHGFLGRRRDLSKNLAFVNLEVPNGPIIQLTSRVSNASPASKEEDTDVSAARSAEPAASMQESRGQSLHERLRAIRPYSAVEVEGTITNIDLRDDRGPHLILDRFPPHAARVDIDLESIKVINPFPKDIIVSQNTNFPAAARHLQLRFHKALQARLLLRNQIEKWARDCLDEKGIHSVETPLLFKSTPEGAREFIVPTRARGKAYALPQSPQQFKQMLMAGGWAGYFQFARCFRDEDLRADRQPEFTQLDLEIAFAKGDDVMNLVEDLMRYIFGKISDDFRLEPINDELVPVCINRSETTAGKRGNKQQISHCVDPDDFVFPRLSYEECMSRFGTDKPDLRIASEIRRIDQILPHSFTSMITKLEKPIVEACAFRLEGAPSATQSFVRKLLNNAPPEWFKNPDGGPVVLMCDSSKPMSGLSSLGHEAAAELMEGSSALPDIGPLSDGDIVLIQARQDKPFEGGSTAMGNIRNQLYHEAVKHKLLPQDRTFKFLWVTGFPLFTPNNSTDPGQGGTSGFSSTHHPFTAPLSTEDYELMLTDPLKAKADHYDLVVNGIELGGGSRRIHVERLQRYVFREVLKMDKAGVARFEHLLQALRAGCPPHAGFALGFDRLCAVLSGTTSVRDVIAFPKSMEGKDLAVNSPTDITNEQFFTYHLQPGRKDKSVQGKPKEPSAEVNLPSS